MLLHIILVAPWTVEATLDPCLGEVGGVVATVTSRWDSADLLWVLPCDLLVILLQQLYNLAIGADTHWGHNHPADSPFGVYWVLELVLELRVLHLDFLEHGDHTLVDFADFVARRVAEVYDDGAEVGDVIGAGEVVV